MNVPPEPDAERLRKVSALLEVALALDEAQRLPWMRSLPPEHQAFVPLLTSLLSRSSVETDTFMREPVGLALGDAAAMELADDQPGDVIGPYRLIHRLGAGGMATVWLAERDDGVLQRQVALKLPRDGWSLGLAQRMARERDILGALEHPRIARLYDAGVTAAGRPWMAMECVSGLPIDAYCSAEDLGVAQRLRLFLQVTDAVSHAHVRLIVHRDLKPSNILVTPDGEVRLLDFGVAKLLEEPDGATSLTQLLGRAVTPDYASPEQVSGQPVTVGTDVYSLGVVLYELLCGQRPYRLERASRAALEEAILKADVPAASARAGSDRRLARQLRGDLDNILAKALRKDAGRRYLSVDAFAADLQRHLDGEPVLARAPTSRYRLAKFVGRHRVGLSVTVAMVTLLVAGLGTTAWQAHEVRLQRAHALARVAHTESALEFVSTVVTEGIRADERLSLSELLDRGVKLAEGGAATTPLDRAVAAGAVSDWLIGLERFDVAERVLQRTLASLPPGFDRSIRNTLLCKHGLALAALSRVDDGKRLLTEALATSEGDDATMADCLLSRAMVARVDGDNRAALEFIQRGLKHLNASGRTVPRARALFQGELGFALALNGRPAEADREFAASVRLFEAAQRGESADAMTVRNNWALSLMDSGNPRAALLQLERAIAIARRLSPDAEIPGSLLSNKALGLRAMARYDEARQAYLTLLAQARKTGDSENQLFALDGLAVVAARAGDLPEAERRLAEAGALMAHDRGLAGGQYRLLHQTAQGVVWKQAARPAQARSAITNVINELVKKGAPPGNMSQLLVIRSDLYAKEGHEPEALDDAMEALVHAQRNQGDQIHSYLTGQAWLTLARLHHAAMRRSEARDALRNAMAHLQATVDDVHPMLREARQLVASLT
jgi:serine/threonine-protein kinase